LYHTVIDSQIPAKSKNLKTSVPEQLRFLVGVISPQNVEVLQPVEFCAGQSIPAVQGIFY